MAVPSYTTDLTDFEDFESANTVSTELTGYTQTAKPASTDTDYPIQGSQHATAEQRSTGKGSLASDYGSNITWTSGWSFFMWGIFLAPAAVNSDANSGIEMCVGSSISDFHRWTVGGNDFGRYPYGGWQNFVVNPEITTGRSTTGSPGTNYRWVGMLCDVISAIAKGSPYGIDVIRYGKGELIVTGGETSNYATFAGMASANDAPTAKWGLFQKIDGGYLWKGLSSIGTSSTAVDFRDSNRNIVVDNTRRVTSGFNRFEINNASSNVQWTNINITSLGTVSKGQFEMIDNATHVDIGGVYTDMDTFVYQSNATVTGRTFRRCGLVTQGGGSFDSCVFEETTNDAAIKVDDLDLIDTCDFSSDGSSHAVELTSAHAGNSYQITGHSFVGYATSNGSTGNEVIYNNSGGAVTITVTNCTGTVSYRNGTGASTTIIIPDVTLTLTGLIDGSDISILEAGTTTELENSQENSGTNYPYSYGSEDAGNYIDVGVFKAGYTPKYIRNYQLSASNGTLPVAQEVDKYYLE